MEKEHFLCPARLFSRNTHEITAGTLQIPRLSFSHDLWWEGEGTVLSGSPRCPAK